MNRFTGIAIGILVALFGLYAGGYWLWVLPARHGLNHPSVRALYVFKDPTAGYALGILYSPVFYCEGATYTYPLAPEGPTDP